MSRIHVMTSIVAVAALAVMVAGRSQTVSAAQRGQSTFTGGNPTTVDSGAVHTSRLRFPKGSRSNWHTHVSGQLLMIEDGKGPTQVRRGPLKEMLLATPAK
jgi:quercetin dioxygenase-like cupin family protein